MAQDLSLARAIFTSALLRSEDGAPEISRDDATLFARTLLRTCNICTSSNIKLCKTFILKSILPSEYRTTALARYLVTLSKSCEPRPSETRIDTTKPLDENEGLGKIINGKVQQPPEPAFKRLHVLYIVHDILCYCHLHPSNKVPETSLEKLKDRIPPLLELAASSSSSSSTATATTRSTRTKSQIQDLLAHWTNLKLFPASTISSYTEKVTLADRTDWPILLTRLNAEEATRQQEEKRQQNDSTKWKLPTHHSAVPADPRAPWHELPAANALYLSRVHGHPLRAAALPQGGFKLPHGGSDAPEELKRDVQRLYGEVVRCFEKFTPADEVLDVDALGNVIWKDPERATRNFWGFSLEGIERRRELARGFRERAVGYEGLGLGLGGAGGVVGDAGERARALAAGGRGGFRGGGEGMGRGRGGYGPSRGGWRGQQWR